MNNESNPPSAVLAAKYEMTILIGREVVGTGVITLYPDKLANHARQNSTDDKKSAEQLQRMADELAFCYEVQANGKSALIRTHISPLAPEIPVGVQLEQAAELKL